MAVGATLALGGCGDEAAYEAPAPAQGQGPGYTPGSAPGAGGGELSVDMGVAGASGAELPTGPGPDGAVQVGGLGPLIRAEGFLDLAPQLGEPLPDAPAGEWNYLEMAGTKCRDGSPAGLYYRYSDSSTNYFVFLEGGGACSDDFFCPLNPQNVDEKVDGETVIEAGLVNFGGASAIPAKQEPRTDGIFKDDPRNPVAGWNAIYVPYCSGDVYGGTREQAMVPKWQVGGPQDFTGYHNTSLMAGRVVATFLDADKALLTGSSAGGVGSLMNAGQFGDLLGNHTTTRGFIVSDSGPVFDDQHLEPCLQKQWRELWGLDDSLPQDCEGCFNADGGGVVRGMGEYLMTKFSGQDQVVGGLISSYDDEIMAMFFGKGLDACAGNPFYPAGRYRAGLEDFRDNVLDPERFGTYFMEGTLHMHIFRPRFYEDNGTGTTIADWLTRLLDNEAVHVAPGGAGVDPHAVAVP